METTITARHYTHVDIRYILAKGSSVVKRVVSVISLVVD